MKTEAEKKETADKFLLELKAVAKKYGAKNLSVCCELEDKYFGIVCADIEGYGDFFEGAIKVARLYQSCREKIKTIFDDFEK